MKLRGEKDEETKKKVEFVCLRGYIENVVNEKKRWRDRWSHYSIEKKIFLFRNLIPRVANNENTRPQTVLIIVITRKCLSLFNVSTSSNRWHFLSWLEESETFVVLCWCHEKMLACLLEQHSVMIQLNVDFCIFTAREYWNINHRVEREFYGRRNPYFWLSVWLDCKTSRKTERKKLYFSSSSH